MVRSQFPDLFLEDMLPALDHLTMGRYKKLPSCSSRKFFA